jgi:hypothetical protein
MPGLSRLALGLDEQHRLHGLDVGADELGQGVDDDPMGQHRAHALRQLVGEVNAQVAADDHLVGRVGFRRLDAGDGAQLASADAHGLLPQGAHLGDRKCVGQDDVPVAMVATDQLAAGGIGRVVGGGHGRGRGFGSVGHGASVGPGDLVENVQQPREPIRS